MSGRIVILAIAVALAVEPTPAATQAHSTPALIARYRDLARAEYSGVRARNTVAFVEQYFRVPGNTGFNASLDLVVRNLRDAGYVREDSAKQGDQLVYRVEQRPMNRPTWEPVDAELTIVGRWAPLLRFATNRNMLAINSYSTPDSGVVADVVFVGAGRPEDYEHADVGGKIVLAEGGIGRVFGEAVTKRGALGALAYAMPAYTKPEINITSIQFGSIPLDSAHRSWGIPLSRLAWDTLRAAVAAGPLRVRIRTRALSYASVERTVVAEVRGTERRDERFVLSAHVQEPGANDNASGVGALGEMARVLGVFVQRRRVVPRRTITMLFGNEVAQTQNYLADDSVRTRGVRWGMSLDMVGEDTRKTGGTFLIEKMPDPSAVWTRGDDRHTEWGGRPLTLADMKPHYFNDFVLNRCLDQAAGRGWVVRTNPYEGGSDHVPFLRFNKPGVLLWHFTDQFYHTDGDRLDNVSAETLENSGICAILAALALTTADGLMARQIIAEVERAAERRLDTELGLSMKAAAAGADREKEAGILRAWADWYDGAVARAEDIEVGGSSSETMAAIAEARARVKRTAEQRIASLRR